MIEKNLNKLIKLIAEIDEFKGNWVLLGKSPAKKLNLLKKQAIQKAVSAISDIENRISTPELDKGKELLLSDVFEKYNFETSSFLDEKEAQDQILDEIMIKDMHNTIYIYSEQDNQHRGAYKKQSIKIDGIKANGKALGEILESVDPAETPIKMKELLDLTNEALNKKHYHYLIVIALFVLNFLSIQPFYKGNVAVSLILARYLLDKIGYGFIKYVSLEAQIAQNLESFYYSILTAQKQKTEPAIIFWIVYFVNCIKKAKDDLFASLANKQEHLLIEHPLSQKILSLFNDFERVDINLLQEHTKANRNTLKMKLRELTKKNLIQKYGNARATYYVLDTDV